MPTQYTSLLGLAKPQTGELTGTWGATVNDYITEYLDAAVAGAQVISGSQTAVTLSKTEGSSLVQAGAGAAGSSQYSLIRCTGDPASTLTITVPATSKVYLVVNATSTSQDVKVVGAGPTTGITVAAAQAALIAWSATDFVLIATTDVAKLSGVLPVANGGTGATSLTGVLKGNGTSPITASNVNLASEVTGTLPVANGGTGATSLTGVLKGNGTSAFTASNVNLASEVTGTLPVANGGTGITSFGSGVATALGQNVTGSGGIVLAASPTMTGTTTVGELTIGGATKETVYALSGTTPALNPSNGGIQTWTLTGNSTPTDSLASGEAVLLMIDDGSAYTITWPSVTWKSNSGNAPTLNTTGYTAILLWKVSSTLYGARVGNA
jgi:hypothetical protein